MIHVFHTCKSCPKNEKVNKRIAILFNLVGANDYVWSISHNIVHHTYTNIQDFDEDVSPAVNVLRFTPNDTYRPIHRFQFIYAWFFYSLMTVMWITTKDIAQIFRYKKMGLTKGQKFSHLIV